MYQAEEEVTFSRIECHKGGEKPFWASYASCGGAVNWSLVARFVVKYTWWTDLEAYSDLLSFFSLFFFPCVL